MEAERERESCISIIKQWINTVEMYTFGFLSV